MTLLTTVFAAIISTIIWYKNAPESVMKVGILCWIYWGASLMWFVDAVFEYVELHQQYFGPDPVTMLNDLYLGLSVVALGLIVWLVILLVKDPKGVVKGTLFRKKSLKSILVVVLTISLPLANVSAQNKQKNTFDPDGVYHARLGIQTSTYLWVMNLHYYNGDSNDLFGTDLEDKLACGAHDEDDDPDGDGWVEKAGTFVDAEIAGNGTYTVELNNADFAGDTQISQLHVATDIPGNEQVKFSNVKAVINGTTMMEFENGFMEEEEPYLTAGEVVLLINSWRDQLVNDLQEMGYSRNGTGYELLSGNGDDSISITFTVSGFNYDKEEHTSSDDTLETAAPDRKEPTSEIRIAIPVLFSCVFAAVIGIVVYRKTRKNCL